MKKATSLLLLLIFTLSLSLPAYAAQSAPGGPGGMGGGSSMNQGMNQGKGQPGGGPGMGGNGFTNQLSSLVTAGTLTQAQADAVEAALKPSQNEKPSSTSAAASTADPSSVMKTKLDALVTAGTITSAEEESILAAIKPANGNQPGQNGNGRPQGNPMESALNSLVTAGTITQDVADTILSTLKPSGTSTTSTSSATTKTNMKEALASELAALVTAGTITQDQSDAISEAVNTAAKNNSGNNGHMRLQVGSDKMTVGSSQAQIDPGYNTAPVIQNGATFVPIRAIIESLGGTVTWDSDTQTLTMTLDDNTVSMTVGSDTATVNGKSVTLTNDAYISNTGRTMIPIRFMAENLGMQVIWDQNTRSIDIQK